MVRRHGVDQLQKQLVTSLALDALLGRSGASEILQALLGLHSRWKAGQLSNGYLSPGQRRKLSRESRVEELADLLLSL